MVSANTLCKNVLNVKNTVIENFIFTLMRMELNTSVSKQDLISGMRMTVLSVTSHALFMTNIPADQPLGEVWTGVVFWLKLNTRHIVSSALNMGCMLPKCHGHIQVVDLPRISTLLLHGLHPIFQEVPHHTS